MASTLFAWIYRREARPVHDANCQCDVVAKFPVQASKGSRKVRDYLKGPPQLNFELSSEIFSGREHPDSALVSIYKNVYSPFRRHSETDCMFLNRSLFQNGDWPFASRGARVNVPRGGTE